MFATLLRMKSKISKSKDARKTGAPPRALYHVYQKLNHLRQLIAEGNYLKAALEGVPVNLARDARAEKGWKEYLAVAKEINK